jgi:hypothetical protein
VIYLASFCQQIYHTKLTVLADFLGPPTIQPMTRTESLLASGLREAVADLEFIRDNIGDEPIRLVAEAAVELGRLYLATAEQAPKFVPVAIVKPPFNPVFEQGRLEFLDDFFLPYGTLLYTDELKHEPPT